MAKKEARSEALKLLGKVRLPRPAQVYDSYPHQLSGGMNQRIMIAMAISSGPELLIADEPTTALDVKVQREILGLLRSLRDSMKLSILFITHDISLIGSFADRLAIMKSGVIVETGAGDEIFRSPKNDYTKKLIRTVEELKKETPRGSASKEEILEIRDLSKTFDVTGGLLKRQRGKVEAVSKISLSLKRGETLGIVGESGSGKTTLARLTLGLTGRDSGEVIFEGRDLLNASKKEGRFLRKDIGFVQQDPYSSLNPRMNILETVTEPLLVHNMVRDRDALRERAGEMLRMVGLDKEDIFKYPHQFSGGQRQRICIARAAATGPKLLICDEPVSSLDIFTQVQILELLKDLQKKYDIGCLFISHDLRVVRYLSDRIVVVYKGRIVERNTTYGLFRNPQTGYTRELLEASGFKQVS
jgi:ABC-type glutathione transport system ATPase component